MPWHPAGLSIPLCDDNTLLIRAHRGYGRPLRHLKHKLNAVPWSAGSVLGVDHKTIPLSPPVAASADIRSRGGMALGVNSKRCLNRSQEIPAFLSVNSDPSAGKIGHANSFSRVQNRATPESNNRPICDRKSWGLFRGLLRFDELEYSSEIRYL